MANCFFVGVDGGASKCTVRLEDASGRLLGQAKTGPANIRLSVQQAWRSIEAALQQIISENALSLAVEDCHVGIGIAGCEVTEAYQGFIDKSPAFASLTVTSDAHTACLAAHQDKDGAIIIAGTGVVGCQLEQGQLVNVGGIGFPHDDEGGGAWLGLQAIKKTVKSLDGRGHASALTGAIMSRFKNDQAVFVSWVNQANSSQFAEIAPVVIELAQQGDTDALLIVQQAAKHLEQIAATLVRRQKNILAPLPLCLVGTVAAYLKSYLPKALQARISDCMAPPEVGAIYLARNKEVKWRQSV